MNQYQNQADQSVPYAVGRPYKGIQVDIYAPLTEEQQDELLSLGLRQDKYNKQRWYLSSKPVHFAIKSFSDITEALKRLAA